MNCLHGVSPREHCPACAAAWRKEHGTTAWETQGKCPHGLASLRDGNEPTRVLMPGCERCGTALPLAKSGKR